MGPPNIATHFAQTGTPILIPRERYTVTVDGVCNAQTAEYADAATFTFTETNPAGGPFSATVYLKHDNTFLYACMTGLHGASNYAPYASVYLDYENGQEAWARYDDLELQTGIRYPYKQAYRGDGVGGYYPVSLPGWSAAGATGDLDSAEFQIPITIAIAGGLCHRPFGLAVYHHQVNGPGDDYGWPSAQYANQPRTWQAVQLDNATCTPTLPVFRLLPVTTTGQTAQGLAGLFDGIGGLPPFSDTSHAGTPRFSVPNTDTGSLLEQYGPSGGFFAFNAGGAFSTTNRGQISPDDARGLACQFLSQHNLFPSQTLPEAQPPCSDRVGDLPYQVTGIYAGKQLSGTGALAAAQVMTTGVLVQIPLGIDAGLGNPLMLRGPGGHLSLIFVTTTMPVRSYSATGQGPMLDSSFPGLAALAIPFSRTLESRGNYTVTDSSQAIQALQALMPGAVITPGNPELVYYADDPAVPQQNLIPTWYFPDAMALVDGHEVSLRGYSTPAVPGFMPNVQITSPANGTIFIVGRPVTITGNISGGTEPYTYTWLMEDGSTLTGITAGGAVSLVTSTLPLPHPGDSVSVTVRLRATDSNGATGEDYLALQPGPRVYLPIVLRNSSGLNSLVVSVEALPASPASPMAFGIEAGWDYPPYGPGGPDLPGVIPDAFGFQSGMLSQGWSQRFFWANANAWERDWRDCSLGGSDCTYGVDRADFVYYPGHGGGGGISVPSTNHDLGWADGSQMRFQNVRWVGFASCATLRAQGYTPATAAPIFTHFHDSFQGSHMLLGFNSSMADVAFGPRLVDNMRVPTWWGIPIPAWQHTIAEAWVLTTFEMNAGKPAYIWVVGSNGYNPYFDKLPTFYTPSPWGRPYPFVEWDWVWWDE
jgi:hypothetical protein